MHPQTTAVNTPPQSEDKTQPPEPAKKSLGSRIILALAFSTVGAKLSFLGLPLDGAALLRNEQMTAGEKFRSIFNGKLLARLQEQMVQEIGKSGERIPSFGTTMRSYAKIFKFTLIITGIAAVAGGVLGWVRGSRIEHTKDILVHPIKSLKLVLGIGSDTKHSPTESAAIHNAPEHKPVTSEPASSGPEWAGRIRQQTQAETHITR